MVWASDCSFKRGDKLPDGPTPKACFAESPSDRKCSPVVPYLRASAISSTKPHHRNHARSQGVLQTQPQLHRDGAGRPNRGRGWGESLIHCKTSRSYALSYGVNCQVLAGNSRRHWLCVHANALEMLALIFLAALFPFLGGGGRGHSTATLPLATKERGHEI